ncbi:hypothetical protein PAPYR_1603 [Paratrimastix pyriformis]|uniref:Uncharacterized protein n=1 Tax=Paratrimastix pyriformis TaxID=342808 RepID=A0ABQ8URZ7_9EUKA|nr:hypothetical protein PAPYR_1603 [Paratrimastix pyriformis]
MSGSDKFTELKSSSSSWFYRRFRHPVTWELPRESPQNPPDLTGLRVYPLSRRRPQPKRSTRLDRNQFVEVVRSRRVFHCVQPEHFTDIKCRLMIFDHPACAERTTAFLDKGAADPSLDTRGAPEKHRAQGPGFMRPPRIRDPIAAPAKVTRFAGETPVLASTSGLRDASLGDGPRVVLFRRYDIRMLVSAAIWAGWPSLTGILWSYVDFLWGLGFPDLLTQGRAPRTPKSNQLCRVLRRVMWRQRAFLFVVLFFVICGASSFSYPEAQLERIIQDPTFISLFAGPRVDIGDLCRQIFPLISWFGHFGGFQLLFEPSVLMMNWMRVTPCQFTSCPIREAKWLVYISHESMHDSDIRVFAMASNGSMIPKPGDPLGQWSSFPSPCADNTTHAPECVWAHFPRALGACGALDGPDRMGTRFFYAMDAPFGYQREYLGRWVPGLDRVGQARCPLVILERYPVLEPHVPSSCLAHSSAKDITAELARMLTEKGPDATPWDTVQRWAATMSHVLQRYPDPNFAALHAMFKESLNYVGIANCQQAMYDNWVLCHGPTQPHWLVAVRHQALYRDSRVHIYRMRYNGTLLLPEYWTRPFDVDEEFWFQQRAGWSQTTFLRDSFFTAFSVETPDLVTASFLPPNTECTLTDVCTQTSFARKAVDTIIAQAAATINSTLPITASFSASNSTWWALASPKSPQEALRAFETLLNPFLTFQNGPFAVPFLSKCWYRWLWSSREQEPQELGQVYVQS